MPVFRGTVSNDMLNGSNSADYMYGGKGSDQLRGFGGADFLYGGEGDDLLYDGTGLDSLYGQLGDDYFAMDNSPEADIVDGGGGNDTVYYFTPINTTTVIDLVDSSQNAGSAAGDQLIGIESVLGGLGREDVRGSDARNDFYASLGSDRYNGRDGVDVYWGYQSSTPIRKFQVAFGTLGAQLAAAAGVTAPPAGAAVVYFELWDDANNNQIVEASEITRYADVVSGVEAFVGTSGDDVMTGSSGSETFASGGGTDKIDGGGGFDLLTFENITGITAPVLVDLTSHQATWLNGQAGLQVEIANIEGVIGSAYGDQLQGSAGRNLLDGQDGDDALDGGGGDDELFGGAGADIMVGGAGADVLSGGLDADLIDGGAGVDTLSYASAKSGTGGSGIAVSLLRGMGASPIIEGSVRYNPESEGDSIVNIENVVGSIYADTIGGDDNGNVLEGRNGSDTISGCGGDDSIYGERDPNSAVPLFIPGVDLSSNQGTFDILEDCGCDDDSGPPTRDYDDFLYGGDGADRIYGQLGDDELYGDEGDDRLFGAQGNDIIDGGAGNDFLDGGLGTDFIYGGDGDDRIRGGEGFDIIFGGAGLDMVDYSASGSGVVVNLGEYWANSGGEASSDYLTEIMARLAEGQDPSAVLDSALLLNLLKFIGSDGTQQSFTLTIPDVIFEVERVAGSNFVDTLIGDANDNQLFGNGGNDTLTSGAGNDLIDGGAGADIMNGGIGSDNYVVDSIFDTVTDADGAGDIDAITSSVNFTLPDFVENLALTGTANLRGTGNALANLINGNAGANVLFGGDGNDRMFGNDGNDVLNGGAGNDRLVGGLGTDRYIFAEIGGTDFIEGFQGGVEKIDLGAIDANSLIANDQAFTFIGNAKFSGAAGQLRAYLVSGVTFVAGDVNGDGVADFLINLGTSSVQIGDFVL